MIDFADMKKELERLSGIEYHSCPDCGKHLRVQKVKKESRNFGRPFVACGCGGFVWCDLPTCKSCGANYLTATVKKPTANQGRKFRACPRQCKGEFRWVD